MSAETQPISPAAFAEAIKDLPLSAVYGKVSELRNSILHLLRSNEDLRVFIRHSEDGPDSAESQELESYIAENEGVIQMMTERIALLKAEVEGRGQPWIEGETERDGDDTVDGMPNGHGPAPVINGAGRVWGHDEEVSAAPRARRGALIYGESAPVNTRNVTDPSDDDIEDEGIHL